MNWSEADRDDSPGRCAFRLTFESAGRGEAGFTFRHTQRGENEHGRNRKHLQQRRDDPD